MKSSYKEQRGIKWKCALNIIKGGDVCELVQVVNSRCAATSHVIYLLLFPASASCFPAPLPLQHVPGAPRSETLSLIPYMRKKCSKGVEMCSPWALWPQWDEIGARTPKCMWFNWLVYCYHCPNAKHWRNWNHKTAKSRTIANIYKIFTFLSC